MAGVCSKHLFINRHSFLRVHCRSLPAENGAHEGRHGSESSIGDNHNDYNCGDVNMLVMDEPHIIQCFLFFWMILSLLGDCCIWQLSFMFGTSIHVYRVLNLF